MGRSLVIATALAALIVPALHAEEADGASRARALVAELGSDDPQARERATTALVALGDAAVPELEAALSAGDAEVRARAQEALSAIRLEKATGPSAWVALPEKETPLAEAFQEVARQSGRTLDVSDVGLAGRTLPGGLGRLPIWAALDRLAEAGECSCAVPFTERIALLPDPLPRVRCYDGPFRIVIEDVTVTRGLDLAGGESSSDTDIELTIEWEPHARPYAVGSEPRVEGAVDDKGLSLVEPPGDDDDVGISRLDEDANTSLCSLLLRGPSPGATRIAKLSGSIDAVFLIDRYDVLFDAPARERKATLAAGSVRVSLTSWVQSSDGGFAKVTAIGLQEAARLSGLPMPQAVEEATSLARFSLRSADGTEVVSGHVSGTTCFGSEDRCDFEVGFDSLPHGEFALAASIVSRLHARKVRFAFDGVPLP